MILAALLAAVATFQPAQPTVGDRIVVEFAGAPVALDPSRDYEVVEERGKRVVVRTFVPKPFAINGTVAGVRFPEIVVPVKSVLKPDDDLKPAPLTPPVATPYPRAPFIAIGIAAICAIVVWVLVWHFARPKAVVAVPAIPADERFRRAVRDARARPERWAALADATRAFLAETRPQLGSDLTTSELVPRLNQEERIVREILRQGDLEKFSLEGAEPENFDDVAKRALEIAS